MTGPCTRPECGGEVHTDGWGNPVRCPHAGEPDDLLHEDCPHCDEAPPRNRMDEHIRTAHADLPDCTALIDNEHGLYTCAFRVGHRDGEHGDWHASVQGPIGRYVWNDSARGARPHRTGPTGTDAGDFLLSVDTSALVQIAPPPQNIVILGEDGRTPLVTIHPTGELEYGPGYTPDEAARRFWDALRRIAPARCPNCGLIGLEGAP